MPTPRPFDAAQDAQLVVFVGDPEAALDADERPKLAEQLGAEGVDRSARNRRRRGAETVTEPFRDLAGGFVRKVNAQIRAGS